VSLDGFATHYSIKGPVSSLSEHVREQFLNDFEGCLLGKDSHEVDTFKRGHHFAALFLGQNRPALPFDSSHGAVAVQRHHQKVPFRTRLLQVTNVSGMQQIKTPVSEDNFLSVSLKTP